MSPRHLSRRPAARAARGFSLIELMIALVLGLLVTLAAIGMFLSNSRTYETTESLSRVQENARMAFELMARDIRESGGNPCSRNLLVANVLGATGGGTAWWNNWANGVQGYENGALAGSLAGTDSIEIMSASSSGATVVAHNPTSATFDVVPQTHGFLANDILVVCDFRQASVFQMSGPSANPVTNGNVVHNSGSGTPGNCSKGLGFAQPIDCSTNGTEYTYGDNSIVVRLQAARWYVANNGRGGNSLFRQALRNNALAAREEVVEGVEDMEITYLLPGGTDYVDSTAIPAARWREVGSVRLDITLSGRENVGTDGSRINRRLQHTVTLRNRNI